MRNKLRKKKDTTFEICLSLYYFVLIFFPPVIPYPHLVLAFISTIVLTTRYKKETRLLMKASGIFRWLKRMLLFFLYIITVPLLLSALSEDIVNSEHYITLFNRYFVLIATIVPCCTLSIAVLQKYDYNVFIEAVVKAGLIEGICSIFAYLSPSIKQFFIRAMSRYSDAYYNTWYRTVRSYGFAGTLVDVFGFGIAIIAGIAFFYGMLEKKRYIFYSFIIISSALLNARTGVIIFLVGIIISAIFLIRIDPKSKIPRLLIIAIIIITVIPIILQRFSRNDATTAWIQSGYQSMIGLLKTRTIDQSTGIEIMKLARQQYWVLPDFAGIIFGTAHSLYGANGYLHSDVGYINDLWIGGIIGCIILYQPIFRIGVELARKTISPLMQFVGVYCIVSFLIFNIKAQAIGYNPGAAALFTVLFTSNFFSLFPNYSKRLLSQTGC